MKTELARSWRWCAVSAGLYLFAASIVAIQTSRGRDCVKATRGMLGTLQQAIKQYRLLWNRPPEKLAELQLGGRFAVLDPDKPLVDAWGRDFVYLTDVGTEENYTLKSKGRDGRFGTADDMDVWKPDAN